MITHLSIQNSKENKAIEPHDQVVKKENNKIKELQTNHTPKLLPNLELNLLLASSIGGEANQIVQMKVCSLFTLYTQVELKSFTTHLS
mgnify:CR=1 FL=1